MIEKLTTLKTLLGSQELILTGSTAMYYHGLMELSEAKDLDIVMVNASATSLAILDRLQEANPSSKHKKGSPVNYSFIYEGIKIDVWLVDSHADKNMLVTKDGIQVASIKSIVAAKLSYNRAKDWVQLMKLSKRIFDETKFTTALGTIVTESGEYSE